MYHLYPSTLDPIAACQFCSRLLKRSLTFKNFGNLWVSKKWCFDILQSHSITRQRNHGVFYAFFFQIFFFFTGYHRYRCNYAETTNHSSEVRTCNCQSGKVKLWYTSLPRIADCFSFWQKMQKCGVYLWSIFILFITFIFSITSLLVKRTPKSNGYRPECK